MEWKETTKTNTQCFRVLYSCPFVFKHKGGVSLAKIVWAADEWRDVGGRSRCCGSSPQLSACPTILSTRLLYQIFRISQRQELSLGPVMRSCHLVSDSFTTTVPHARPLIPLSRFHMATWARHTKSTVKIDHLSRWRNIHSV